ncbi:MAG TPA: SIMPL domain-containing protein [Blastocatellia bacterium]|nr:SIMPL domain-containing protein [Blastocatellia bacterium]
MKLAKMFVVLSAVLCSLSSIAANGQNQKQAVPVIIHATAEGVAVAATDTADLNSILDSSGATAAEAFDTNQREFEKIIAHVRSRLGTNVEIISSEPSLANYGSTRPSTAPSSDVRRDFTVRIHKTDRLSISKALDSLSEMNLRPDLRYFSSEEGKTRAEALRLATVAARNKADAMASALGMKVVRLVSVEDQGAFPRGSGGYINSQAQIVWPTTRNADMTPDSGSGSSGVWYTKPEISVSTFVTVIVEAAP